MADDAPVTDAEIDAHLARRDPDRWLSARLIADAAARREVLALYAFEDAIRSVAGSVSNPMLGEVRFAWWSEAVEAMAAGAAPRAHPALLGIAAPLAQGRLAPEPLLRLIDARHADLDAAPFTDEAALDRFLYGAYAAPMQAAAGLLDRRARELPLTAAGRAWGLASLLRETPLRTAAGRRWAPPGWGDAPTDLSCRVQAEVESALRESASQVTALPVKAFPGVAHTTLAKLYARGRDPGEVEKRARMLWAAVRGAV